MAPTTPPPATPVTPKARDTILISDDESPVSDNSTPSPQPLMQASPNSTPSLESLMQLSPKQPVSQRHWYSIYGNYETRGGILYWDCKATRDCQWTSKCNGSVQNHMARCHNLGSFSSGEAIFGLLHHYGTLGTSSEPGKGTWFWICNHPDCKHNYEITYKYRKQWNNRAPILTGTMRIKEHLEESHNIYLKVPPP
jgi:hypothetical protein